MALLGRRRPAPATAPDPGSGAPTTSVRAPVAGRVVPLAEIGDGVFSAGLMGSGAGIVPTLGEARAPISGTLTTVFPTGHAFGIRSADGVEVLVHIGIDTVDLAGEGFAVAAVQGQQVDAGDLLGTFDLATIEAAGRRTTTLVVVTNTSALAAVVLAAEGEVGLGDVLLAVDAGTERSPR